jgi:hypothetical protein
VRRFGESSGGRMNICVSLCINVEFNVTEMCQFYSEISVIQWNVSDTLESTEYFAAIKWTEGVFNYILNLNTTELDMQVNVVDCYCSS